MNKVTTSPKPQEEKETIFVEGGLYRLIQCQFSLNVGDIYIATKRPSRRGIGLVFLLINLKTGNRWTDDEEDNKPSQFERVTDLVTIDPGE